MSKIQNVASLLPILVGILFGLTDAADAADADISSFQILQLCEGKYMETIAYPGDPTKFIVCLNENTQVGVCRMENSSRTCFSERQQKCQLDFCSDNPPETAYVEFVKQYCENDVNFLVKLPAEDCEHFYMCMGSTTAYIYSACPAGQHFSPVNKTCMRPLEAQCQTLKAICNDKPNHYRFESTNCYDFYECVHSKPIARTCPYGENFDIASKKCIPVGNSKCVDKINRVPKCGANDNGRYFTHTQCDRFYICVNSVALEGQCAQDYLFDMAAQMCRKDTKGVCRG